MASEKVYISVSGHQRIISGEIKGNRINCLNTVLKLPYWFTIDFDFDQAVDCDNLSELLRYFVIFRRLLIDKTFRMVLNVIEWLKAKLCGCCASLESEEQFEERPETAQAARAQGGPPVRENTGCQRPTPQLLWGPSCIGTKTPSKQLRIKNWDEEDAYHKRHFVLDTKKIFYHGHEKTIYPGHEKTFYHEKTFNLGHEKTFYPGHEKTFYNGHEKTFSQTKRYFILNTKRHLSWTRK
ncbi:hypothetical protein CEXT_142241 [Caerostris extrusa]|uniref:Uncharacterized protein n=1 Tax=Caerostris extrusa TaxID=172846 RepID=A0AAV4T4Z3_CAEEX|nr:hypothetical protein CEXT_142241 [Caerostris extrusa]